MYGNIKLKKMLRSYLQKMIKNMDIAQLAIKQAKINVLSDLVEMTKIKRMQLAWQL